MTVDEYRQIRELTREAISAVKASCECRAELFNDTMVRIYYGGAWVTRCGECRTVMSITLGLAGNNPPAKALVAIKCRRCEERPRIVTALYEKVERDLA